MYISDQSFLRRGKAPLENNNNNNLNPLVYNMSLLIYPFMKS